MKKEYVKYAIAGVVVCVIAVLYTISHIGEIAEAKKAVRARVVDPTSVLFRDIHSGKSGGSVKVCGEYNAKNRFGAYVGYTGFSWRKDGSVVILEQEVADWDAHYQYGGAEYANAVVGTWVSAWKLSACKDTPTEFVKEQIAADIKRVRDNANLGDRNAQCKLASLYRRGEDIEQNYVQYYVWATLCLQGVGVDINNHTLQHEKFMFEDVKNTMTNEQISEGDRMVRDLQAKFE